MTPRPSSPSITRALQLLTAGPTAPHEIHEQWGWATIRTLVKNELVEVDHQIKLPTGGHLRTYYRLTGRGWLFAQGAEVGQSVLAGECCEAALMGIEGEHDQLCRRRVREAASS